MKTSFYKNPGLNINACKYKLNIYILASRYGNILLEVLRVKLFSDIYDFPYGEKETLQRIIAPTGTNPWVTVFCT